jgi:hypothetical protein
VADPSLSNIPVDCSLNRVAPVRRRFVHFPTWDQIVVKQMSKDGIFVSLLAKLLGKWTLTKLSTACRYAVQLAQVGWDIQANGRMRCM